MVINGMYFLNRRPKQFEITVKLATEHITIVALLSASYIIILKNAAITAKVNIRVLLNRYFERQYFLAAPATINKNIIALSVIKADMS